MGKLLTLRDLTVIQKTRKVYNYTDNLGYQRREEREIEETIYPSVKKIKNGVQIHFSEELRNTEFTKDSYTRYIADVFNQNSVTETKKLLMVRTPNPYIVNYFQVHPVNYMFKTPIDEDSEFKAKLDKVLDKDSAELLFGEPQVELNVPDQIVWPLTASPHVLVAGQTRSGKTKTILSFITQIATVYPESKFFFADGKSSPDYDHSAEFLSSLPVAKPHHSEDPLVNLAYMVDKVWAEYENRKRLFEELAVKGNSCSTYIEYNNYVDEKLPRVFLFIDEFAAFCLLAPDKVASLLTVKGTLFNKIRRLLAESASYGFSIIIASQRVQNTDFPTAIRDNLTTWLIHSVNEKAAEFLDLKGKVGKLKPGAFILKIQGLRCENSGEANIESRLPYVGNEPQKVKTLKKDIVKESFDEDYIYTTGLDTDYSKLPPNSLKKYVKNLFCVREGFEVIKNEDAEHDHLSLFVKKGNKQYAIGFVEVDELIDETFYTRLNRFLSDEEKLMQKIFL